MAKLRGYNGPQMTAQSLSEQIVETERKTYKIIDVGAGTGLVGEEVIIVIIYYYYYLFIYLS